MCPTKVGLLRAKSTGLITWQDFERVQVHGSRNCAYIFWLVAPASPAGAFFAYDVFVSYIRWKARRWLHRRPCFKNSSLMKDMLLFRFFNWLSEQLFILREDKLDRA